MKWINIKNIFKIGDHELPKGCIAFAQSPQALVFDDFVRVYFCTRSLNEITKNYLSHIAYVDFDLELQILLKVSKEQVIPLGDLGTFDEHGIFPFNPIRVKDRILAYTCGWSRRDSVSVETSTGLVESLDGGETFSRLGPGPVLTSSLNEPFLVGDSFVKYIDGIYHMWYMFGKRWIDATTSEPPARVYKIGYARSTDGSSWVKNEGKEVIQNVLGIDECQALPTIEYHNGLYHMFFCYRQATDFRKNPDRGYKLGYAYSNDLESWTRNDEIGNFKGSGDKWDQDMQAYPNLFKVKDKLYLLYNGNEFGKNGFGIAELNE